MLEENGEETERTLRTILLVFLGGSVVLCCARQDNGGFLGHVKVRRWESANDRQDLAAEEAAMVLCPLRLIALFFVVSVFSVPC